ncbi:STAS domain-containing protein [Sporosarcina sp. ACRSL]|uniref:STAS domain-containing protein n=1 Tax=Sporosarcina sp. ACRSL TaxID=2918215 RepID=UPI001EF54439|nr:STAS domain-containing protein [Sporosarcina sp. ACRSL]MCG7345439.1 STAS domain-containing protein [Sporosarcina sp. ACRSL]
MDYEKEIVKYKERIAELEQTIKKTSVPIISSIVKDTILVPIVGYTGAERFELIRTIVLEHIDNYREVNSVIFDFTAADFHGKDQDDFNSLALELQMLNNTLKLMDVRPISVGFNPLVVRKIVAAGVQMEFESYVNFRTALKVLLKEKNETF